MPGGASFVPSTLRNEMEVVIGAAIGFLLGVAADVVRSWLDRKRRVEQRAEEAATELLRLLDEARQVLRPASHHDSDVDDDALGVAVGKIRQKSILLASKEQTRRIDLLAEILDRYLAAREFTGDVPSRIGWFAWKDGQDALWRILHNEPLGDPSDEVKEYKSSIDEHDQMWEEHMEEEAKRRKLERDKPSQHSNS